MPRAGLSRSAVVTAGAELADDLAGAGAAGGAGGGAGGTERLTLAAVAARFDVKLPSLYKHVGGLDDLQRGIAVLGLHELGQALSEAAVGKARGDAMRALARAYRAYALARPGRYAATLRAPAPGDAEHLAAAEQVVSTVVAAMSAYGLTGADAIDGVRILRSALHGFVALETGGGFGLPQDVDRTYERLLDALDDGLSGLAAPR